MTKDPVFDDINEAKASMDHIYDQPDPRQYFRELNHLGYAIPGEAKPIFQKLISHLQSRLHDPINILDLGCSYGVNAALLKHDLSMADLYAHWDEDEIADAAPEEVIQNDRRFFAELPELQDINVIGIDVAENAIGYATKSGLLDDGLTIDLEIEALPAEAEEELASVDLVTSTGCVGYITEKSFDRLMPVITRGRKPWVANFVLRMFPFDAISQTLSKWGYVTEKLDGNTFVQREFASTDEREQVLEQMIENHVDFRGEEVQSQLLAEFYLSRPASEASGLPLERLIAASA
jgi:SAM-dependent methyltransferase